MFGKEENTFPFIMVLWFKYQQIDFCVLFVVDVESRLVIEDLCVSLKLAFR